MSSVFGFIVLCALCEVYRTHRKHKRRLEEEAESSLMWHQPPPPSKPQANSNIKMTSYKPVSYHSITDI